MAGAALVLYPAISAMFRGIHHILSLIIVWVSLIFDAAFSLNKKKKDPFFVTSFTRDTPYKYLLYTCTCTDHMVSVLHTAGT